MPTFCHITPLLFDLHWLPVKFRIDYLTIIPRARMGYESIAHEADGRMGY